MRPPLLSQGPPLFSLTYVPSSPTGQNRPRPPVLYEPGVGGGGGAARIEGRRRIPSVGGGAENIHLLTFATGGRQSRVRIREGERQPSRGGGRPTRCLNSPTTINGFSQARSHRLQPSVIETRTRPVRYKCDFKAKYICSLRDSFRS